MRRLLLGAALLLGGCAYYSGYNGIHQAGRLADEARRSAREGRPGQAQDYWARAAVKAESLLVRQPDGKWSAEARLIRGEALAALGRCSESVAMLRQAREQVTSERDRAQAAYAIGRCEIQLGQPALAAVTLEDAVASEDEGLRSDAYAMRGRALLLSGDPQGARAAYAEAGVSPYSIEPLAAAAGSGALQDVLAGVDDIASRGDSLYPWDSLFNALGRQNAEVASIALERARELKAIPAVRLPGLLAADAQRLPPDGRRARREELIALAPTSELAEAAHFAILQEAIAEAASLEALAPLADSLGPIVAAGLGAAPAAAALVRQIGFVGTADTVVAGAPQGDLRLFLAAEVARDSLGAPTIALGLFRRIVTDWPDGAYAPKALLAARRLDPALAEITDSLLLGRYAGSPYVVAARGGDRTSFLALEDSLARYAVSLAGGADPRTPTRAGARPPRRPGDARPDDPDQPRRTRPTRGGRRVEAEP